MGTTTRGADFDLDAGNDRRYRVYVLRLKNGDLYVGSTAKSIRQRIAEHCDPTSKRRARAVRRFGVEKVELRKCIRKSYASRSAAVRAERRLAERLRQDHKRRNKTVRVHQG